jgi:hypothetical protein
VSVGDADRSFEKARFLDPRGASHLAIAIQGEPTRKDWISRLTSSRQDRCHARSDRTLSNNELPLARDQRDVSDFDAGDIRYRIELSRNTIEWNAEVPRARLNQNPRGVSGHISLHTGIFEKLTLRLFS